MNVFPEKEKIIYDEKQMVVCPKCNSAVLYKQTLKLGGECLSCGAKFSYEELFNNAANISITAVTSSNRDDTMESIRNKLIASTMETIEEYLSKIAIFSIENETDVQPKKFIMITNLLIEPQLFFKGSAFDWRKTKTNIHEDIIKVFNN